MSGFFIYLFFFPLHFHILFIHSFLLAQVNSAFVSTVMQGAETVVDGFVEPVNGNPGDPAFLWGGLFMSQGAASAVFGGERGRR